jgi:hypothetical protein
MDRDLPDELNLPGTAPGSLYAQHAVLVAALLHLMSHYTINSARNRDAPCVKLASVIERHLTALARLPDADPVLRATCEQLSAHWAALVDSALPPPVPVRRPLLERLLRPAARKVEPLGAVA